MLDGEQLPSGAHLLSMGSKASDSERSRTMAFMVSCFLDFYMQLTGADLPRDCRSKSDVQRDAVVWCGDLVGSCASLCYRGVSAGLRLLGFGSLPRGSDTRGLHTFILNGRAQDSSMLCRDNVSVPKIKRQRSIVDTRVAKVGTR